ncbi:neural cell adhesion molecule 2-like isoform X1 [Rhopilema esculentum]|uniref:neural cell adhesion molecule 2-like isoform X1 n=2 Tax=Rhopilema esculentum TaxID=499914 RepID=UPI0031D5DCB8
MSLGRNPRFIGSKRKIKWMNTMARTSLVILTVLISSCYAAFRWELAAYSQELGDTVALKCLSDDAATFEVYHKGVKVVTGGKYTVTSYTYEIDVRLTGVGIDEAGEYECRVSGSTEVQKTRVMLKANYPDNGKTFYKTLGTRSTVPFSIIAYPRPEIEYLIVNAVGTKTTVAKAGSRGDMRVGGDKYSINSTNGHLVIFSVQKTDGGKYAVQSVGAGSQKNGEFTLVVGDKPQITTAPDALYKLVSGKAATITCKFDKEPDTVKWEYTPKGGAKVEITKVSSSGGLSLDGTNLKIASVDVKSEGATLTCIGSNRFGETKASSKIETVFVTPKIEPLVNIDIAQGKSKTLVCKASGNPAPQVTWHKMVDKTFSKIDGQKQKPGNSTYTIASASLSDAGTYKCMALLADMASLNNSATLTITILTLPVISEAETTKSKTYAVGLEQSHNLTCVASGNPLPSLVFKKDETVLPGAIVEKTALKVKATLKHLANASSDSGVVVCVAENLVGNASRNIDIKIIDLPVAPINLVASKVERTSFVLTWDPVPGASRYEVKQYMKGVIGAPTMPSMKIEGLAGGADYKFAVAAVNIAGSGPYSTFLPMKTQKFDPPAKVVISDIPSKFDKNDITIKWDKPYDGGDANLLYSVTYCQVDGGAEKDCKTVNTKETTVDLKNLKEDTEYSFTIKAENKRGSGEELKFNAKVGSSKAPPPPTKAPTTTPPDVVVPGEKKGLSGGAIAGIIIAVILILLLVIDLFCCFFNECGFTYCCYQTCCPTKGKESGGADGKDPEKAELKDVGNDHDGETKTAPEEKQALTEKKTEDV